MRESVTVKSDSPLAHTNCDLTGGFAQTLATNRKYLARPAWDRFKRLFDVSELQQGRFTNHWHQNCTTLSEDSRQLRLSMRKLLLVLVLALLAASASADSISTEPYWDGSSGVAPFGNPNTATYGQTITATPTLNELDSFSFHILGGNAPFVFQAYVMNWSGSQASGSVLYSSDPVNYTPDQNNYQTLYFGTGNLGLVPGQQYVLFLSVSQNYDPLGGGLSFLGLVLSDDPNADYPGGNFVFLNNGGDSSQWTSTAWSNFGSEDLAFNVNTPEPASLILLGSGLLGIGGTLRKSFLN
jgi:hypothetical protein